MRSPKYRRRPDRNTGFVEWRGRRYHFPGRYGSPESLKAYHDFCRQNLNQKAPVVSSAGPVPTIAVLVRAYLDHALSYYGAGQEYDHFRSLAAILLREAGDCPVEEFGPQRLARIREAAITGSWIRPGERYRAWSRMHTNRQVNRIRRMFKWGVSQEVVSAAVLTGLQALEPLRAGKTLARETEPVAPVPVEHVYACQMVATRVLACQQFVSMVQPHFERRLPMGVIDNPAEVTMPAAGFLAPVPGRVLPKWEIGPRFSRLCGRAPLGRISHGDASHSGVAHRPAEHHVRRGSLLGRCRAGVISALSGQSGNVNTPGRHGDK